MTEAKQTIEQALEELNYKPVEATWAKLTEDQKWGAINRKRNEREVGAAKETLTTFVNTPAGEKLPQEVKDSIQRLTRKAFGGAGKGRANIFLDKIKELFPKAGAKVSELDIFKATKMGRGEMKAKIRENLKSNPADERMWIELDAAKEVWVLLSVGAGQPKGWLGKDLFPKPEAVK